MHILLPSPWCMAKKVPARFSPQEPDVLENNVVEEVSREYCKCFHTLHNVHHFIFLPPDLIFPEIEIQNIDENSDKNNRYISNTHNDVHNNKFGNIRHAYVDKYEYNQKLAEKWQAKLKPPM